MKTLKSFEFPDRGDRSTYDWTKLLNGKIYQLEAGKDYTCKPETFITQARTQAKKAGKGLRVSKVDGGIVIQAYKLEAGEASEPTGEENNPTQQ